MTNIVVGRETRHLTGWHRWHFWPNWKNRQVKNSSSNPSPLPSQTKRFVLHIDEIDMGMWLQKHSSEQNWTVESGRSLERDFCQKLTGKYRNKTSNSPKYISLELMNKFQRSKSKILELYGTSTFETVHFKGRSVSIPPTLTTVLFEEPYKSWSLFTTSSLFRSKTSLYEFWSKL